MHAPMPWERQEGETDTAFEAFCIYRDLGGTRTLQKVRQARGNRVVTHLERWSRRFAWVKRCAEWDLHVDRTVQEKLIRQAGRMRARHAQEAQEIQQDAIKRLRALSNDAFTASDLIKLYTEAVRIERQATGAADFTAEVRHEHRHELPDVSSLLKDPAALEILQHRRDRRQPTQDEPRRLCGEDQRG